jgi:hypothetical protein
MLGVLGQNRCAGSAEVAAARIAWASLSLPAPLLPQAIAGGKPLIAKFDLRVITVPDGGHRLTPVKRRCPIRSI